MASEHQDVIHSDLLGEVRRYMEAGCPSTQLGRPRATSEFGLPYKTFSLTIGPKMRDRIVDSGELPYDDIAAVERGALIDAIAVWKTAALQEVPEGALPVLIWRRLPELDSTEDGAAQIRLLKLRFRAHYMAQVDYQKGPTEPVDNTA